MTKTRTGRMSRAWGSAVALVLVLVLMMAESAPAWAASWSSVPGPSLGALNTGLLGVSCVPISASKSACEAVGYYYDGTSYQPLAESWNGTYWSVFAPLPTPNPPTGGVLLGVSCISANSCEAVGRAYENNTDTAYQTLAETWNGNTKTWSMVPTPSMQSQASALNAVSCEPGTTSCMAVGGYVGTTAAETLAESWNASSNSWQVVPSANPTKAQGSVLVGVSCASATSCDAVGNYANSNGVKQSLAESWDSTSNSWQITASQNEGTQDNVLNAVSCTSPSSCQAVGGYVNGAVNETLTESWDASSNSWQVTSSPNRGGKDTLWGVSCKASSCQAVGTYSNGGSTQTLVESGNGSTWSLGTSPNEGGAGSYLQALSCVSSTSCQAVGNYISVENDVNGSNVTQSLIVSGSATRWQVVTSPTESNENSALTAVSCVSANSCEAVGNFEAGSSSDMPLAGSWNGIWSPASPVLPEGAEAGDLESVSCISGSCDAVGFDNANGVDQPLVESGGGTNWTASSPALPQGAQSGALNAVSCSSSTSCQAVGYYVSSSGDEPLIESGGGTKWTAFSPALPQGAQSGVLWAASCDPAGACEAVGDYVDSSGVEQTLIESLSGTTWQAVPSADGNKTEDNILYGVSCPSTTSCHAVGYYVNGSLYQTLTESLSGGKWQLVPSPDEPKQNNSLRAVSCVSPNSCEAVGYYLNSSRYKQPLIESLNGTKWTLAPISSQGPQDNFLYGVSCVVGSCEAVGEYYTGTLNQPLALSLSTTSGGALPSHIHRLKLEEAASKRKDH